jgi:hypothetical protein
MMRALFVLVMCLAAGACSQPYGIYCSQDNDVQCSCLIGDFDDRPEGACAPALVDDDDDDPDDTFCCAEGRWPDDAPGSCQCNQVFCYDTGFDWCVCTNLSYLDDYDRLDTCAADTAIGYVCCTTDTECDCGSTPERCAEAGGVVSDACTTSDLRGCWPDWRAVPDCLGEE